MLRVSHHLNYLMETSNEYKVIVLKSLFYDDPDENQVVTCIAMAATFTGHFHASLLTELLMD